MSFQELLTGCLSWNGLSYIEYQDHCRKLYHAMIDKEVSSFTTQGYEWYVNISFSPNGKKTYHLMKVSQVDIYPDE